MKGIYKLALGGTAVGTGINAPKNFDKLVAKKIADITDEPFVTSENKFHALTSKDALVACHGAIKGLAANMMKIANDVRWLASGPRLGLSEIYIPENEPGSSIMPGKVNPVIPEVVNQVAFKVIGNDMTITMAAEGGQLELNAFEPVVFYCLFESIDILASAVQTFVDNCVTGITANEARCQELVDHSIGVVTALCPYLGYKKSAELAKKALRSNKSVKDLILEEKILTAEEVDNILDPVNMTEPISLKAKKH